MNSTCFVYILFSKNANRYYIGSSEDPQRRLRQHNDPEYKGSRTTKVWPGPWEMVLKKEFENRSAAMKVEKQIKKQGAKRYLERSKVESRPWRDLSIGFVSVDDLWAHPEIGFDWVDHLLIQVEGDSILKKQRSLDIFFQG